MHPFYATRSSGGTVLTHTVHILWVPRSSYLAIPIQAYAPEVRRAQKNNHHPTRPFFFFFLSNRFTENFPLPSQEICVPPGEWPPPAATRRLCRCQGAAPAPTFLAVFSSTSPPLPLPPSPALSPSSSSPTANGPSSSIPWLCYYYVVNASPWVVFVYVLLGLARSLVLCGWHRRCCRCGVWSPKVCPLSRRRRLPPLLRKSWTIAWKMLPNLLYPKPRCKRSVVYNPWLIIIIVISCLVYMCCHFSFIFLYFIWGWGGGGCLLTDRNDSRCQSFKVQVRSSGFSGEIVHEKNGLFSLTTVHIM